MILFLKFILKIEDLAREIFELFFVGLFLLLIQLKMSLERINLILHADVLLLDFLHLRLGHREVPWTLRLAWGRRELALHFLDQAGLGFKFHLADVG